MTGYNFNKIKFLAYSVQYDNNLNITDLKNVNIILPEAKPAGTYLMILFNEKTAFINIDKNNQLYFKKGYYIYIDHDDKNIFNKISAHKSGRKNISHAFYELKKNMKIISDIPILTEKNIGKELSDKMKNLGCEEIKSLTYMNGNSFFLLYSTANPLHMEKFWDFVLKKRFNIKNYKSISKTTGA